MKAANLALRFLLELAALGGLAYWGAHTGSGVVRVLLAIAAPLLAAIVWGLFAAPKAARRLPRAPRVAVEAVFLALVVVNGALVYAWDG